MIAITLRDPAAANASGREHLRRMGGEIRYYMRHYFCAEQLTFATGAEFEIASDAAEDIRDAFCRAIITADYRSAYEARFGSLPSSALYDPAALPLDPRLRPPLDPNGVPF